MILKIPPEKRGDFFMQYNCRYEKEAEIIDAGPDADCGSTHGRIVVEVQAPASFGGR